MSNKIIDDEEVRKFGLKPADKRALNGILQHVISFCGFVFIFLVGLTTNIIIKYTNPNFSQFTAVQNFFYLLALILLIVIIFDILTIYFHIRPSESKPAPLNDSVSIFEVMRLRHSCRSFQPRNLSDADNSELKRLIERQSLPSARLGAKRIRFEFVNAAIPAWPIMNCNQYIVAIAPKEYNRNAVIDVGRCLQKVVLQATKLGIATCWVGPGADHKGIVKQLGQRFDADNDHIICVCAVGYESIFTPIGIRVLLWIFGHNSRLPLRQLFFCDDFDTPLTSERAGDDEWNKYVQCFVGCRWSPSSYNEQPTRCVAVTKEMGNEIERFDFCAKNGSRYYAPVALGIWLANWEMGCEQLGIDGHFERIENAKLGDCGLTYDISWIPRK